MEYIVNEKYKIPNGLRPGFYTILSFKIPKPQGYGDVPIILAALHNAKKDICLYFNSVESLGEVFNLDAVDKNLKTALRQGLQKAGQRSFDQTAIEKIV